MRVVFKTLPFLRALFGLVYLPYLYSAVRVGVNFLTGNISPPFQDSFMIDNYFDLIFFFFITFVFSRFFFVYYEIDEDSLCIKHPLGRKRTIRFSEMELIEENGAFTKWSSMYKGLNWIRIYLKSGKEISITFVDDHFNFVQSLKAHQYDKQS